MSQTTKKKKDNRAERFLMVLSLIGLLLALAPLVSDDIYSRFFDRDDNDANGELVGQIQMAQNDIRHKNNGTFAWKKARTQQNVKLGDSIFTGQRSKSQIKLSNGQKLDLGENSLVTFTKVDNLNIPSLEMGNFMISGSAKVMVNGELLEIDGQNSKVQLIIDKKSQKPILKLVEGSAKTKTRLGEKPMVVGAVDQLQKAVVPAIKIEAQKLAVFPLPAPADQSAIRTDEFNDFYIKIKEQWTLRPQRKTFLHFPLEVSWRTEGPVGRVYGQLSNDEKFEQVSDSFLHVDANSNRSFLNSYLGDNWVRLSVDGKTWSNAQVYSLESKPLAIDPPLILPSATQNYILDEQVGVQLSFQYPPSIMAAALEISDTPQFLSNRTRVQWVTQPQLNFNFKNSQILFLRVRGVNARYQVTAASTPLQIVIEKPERPLMPLLSPLASPYIEGDVIDFKWAAAKHAALYEVAIFDQTGKSISRQKVRGLKFEHVAKQKGQYRLGLTAIDRFGRRSETPVSRFLVVSKPVAPPPRQPAVENKLALEQEPELPSSLNRNFASSKVAVEGAAFTVFSSEQVNSDLGNPIPLMLGINWTVWKENQGFESQIKTKTIDVKKAEGANISPFIAEFRYHLRRFFNWTPFPQIGRYFISMFGGVEIYRNSASGPFAPQYDLIKAGLDFEFPIFSRWDTGGEFTYGFGLDQSKKYEISGHLHYYMERNWSLGVGYRMHLFEAGSNASTPYGLPFREGFGEGYSVLRWHY